MAVYKKANETDMFLGITINNIKVALYAFIAGIFAGLGTIYIIIQNAIMLGSFQYFFMIRVYYGNLQEPSGFMVL